MDDATKIAKWLRETGDIWRPISDCRTVECEHGRYGWEDCGECSIRQAADAIEAGEWNAPSITT